MEDRDFLLTCYLFDDLTASKDPTFRFELSSTLHACTEVILDLVR